MNLDIGARLCAQHQPQHAGNIQSAAAGSSTTAALQEIRPGSWSQCMLKSEWRLSMNRSAELELGLTAVPSSEGLGVGSLIISLPALATQTPHRHRRFWSPSFRRRRR